MSLLKTIEISLQKTLDEQEQIVSKLDALATETQRIESVYQQKLAALDALKNPFFTTHSAGSFKDFEYGSNGIGI